MRPGATGQFGVAFGNVQVSLGHRHLGIVEDCREKWPVLDQMPQLLFALLCDELLQTAAQTVPARQRMATLGPGEHPGDGTQALDARVRLARCRPRAHAHALDHVDRRGVAKVRGKICLAVNQLTIRVPTALGQPGHVLLPALRHRGPQLAIAHSHLEHSTSHLLQVSQRDRAQCELAMDHFALLGGA